MPGLRDPAVRFTLLGVLMALFLGALDQTIVATALPRIVDDLSGVERYSWVATVYLLASTAMVPIYGKLADMIARRTVQLWAVSLFLAGSLLCGLAGLFGPVPLVGDGMNQLILFRAIQGIGGAGLFALPFIVIADLFPPAERGRYQGLVGAVFGVSSVLGPLVGGLLADHGDAFVPGVAGWRWVFLVNLPIGLTAMSFIVRRMPLLPPLGPRRPLDLGSAALLLVGLVPLVLVLQLDRRSIPWNDPVTLALAVTSGVGLVAFVRRSLVSDNPILNLGLFRNPVFSRSVGALFFLGAAFLGLIVFLPLFIVNVVGVSSTSAGISLIPLSLGVVAGATVAGQLVSRVGHYRRFMLGGGLLLFVGALLLASMPADIAYGRVVLYMLLCGIGVGPTLPLYPLAVQNSVDVREIGQATSASQFFRQIGGAVGAAAMGAILGVTLASAAPEGASPEILREAFALAMRRIFLGVSILVAFAWIVTLFIPELPLRRAQDRPAPTPE